MTHMINMNVFIDTIGSNFYNFLISIQNGIHVGSAIKTNERICF